MNPLSAAEWSAIGLSLRVGLVATLVSLPFGVFLGWILSHRRFRGRALLETLISLPLVLPPVVTGWLLLMLLGSRGPLGMWLESIGVPIAFTWRAAAVASAVLGFPLLVRTVQVAMEGIDPQLVRAARTLGAGPWRAFFTVTLPMARSGVWAGAILAFARSIGEFGATMTFAGNIPGESRTLPLAMYTLIQSPGGEAAVLRLGVLSVLLAAGALLIGERLRRRAADQRGGH